MDHGPAVKLGVDNATEFKQILGLKLFFSYSIFYAIFVVINLVKPTAMELIIIFGLNLAVVYGFALIVIAIIMGLIYNKVCTAMEYKLNKPEEEGNK